MVRKLSPYIKLIQGTMTDYYHNIIVVISATGILLSLLLLLLVVRLKYPGLVMT